MEHARHNENFVIQLMSHGFTKAVDSFSRIIGRQMTLAHSNAILVRHENDFSYITKESGELLVLTTQMIGELNGKSYLIVSEAERDEICKTVKRTNNQPLSSELQEALLLEIDNIVSASVIAEISNGLQREVYGDVPGLQYIAANNIQDFMERDFAHDNSNSIILCNTTFVIDNRDHIHPQFIWKLNTKIFEMIPAAAKTLL